MSASSNGRRILVAVVTGNVGARIQAWRERHDPDQARRLPPHATLCYWAPHADTDLIEKQVRHAFAESVTVHLGKMDVFDNKEQTFYVEVTDTVRLDQARERLYDGRFLELPRDGNWTWHVTCVRKSLGRDRDALRLAASELVIDESWTIDRVAYMELRDGGYETIAAWELGAPFPVRTRD